MPRRKKRVRRVSAEVTRKKINKYLSAMAEMKEHCKKQNIPGLARNLKYREWGTVEIIKTLSLSPGIHLNKKGSGTDASSPTHPKQEIKSNVITPKSLKDGTIRLMDGTWYFDKTNVKMKRERALDNDSYIFTVTEENDCYPLLILYIQSKSGCDKIKNLLKIKQDDKLEMLNVRNQAGWDTVQMLQKEIIELLDTNEYYVIVKSKLVDPVDYKIAMLNVGEYKFEGIECTNYTTKTA